MRKYHLLCLLFCSVGWAQENPGRQYEVTFSGLFLPVRGVVAATITVTQPGPVLRQLEFTAPEPEFGEFSGDGKIQRQGRLVTWKVPVKGGSLHYEVRVNHERGGMLDARMTSDWAILRLDDLFPPAKVRSLVNSGSVSRLELSGPKGWRFESRYGPVEKTRRVEDPTRRFDRPTGWLAAGKLGIRRDLIAGRRVTIAAPQNQGMRRLDIMAFIRWTLPTLTRAFANFPPRLLIVGGSKDMWRGGLSGPDSLYLHPDRPLISENSTSTLLHELMHMITGQARVPKEDWIIEGLAEYYSLEILRRSGGISSKRFDQAMQSLAAWAQKDDGRLVSPSAGANTARAALVFNQIALELKDGDAGSLDALIRKLLKSSAIDSEQLLLLTESALGSTPNALRQSLDRYLVENP